MDKIYGFDEFSIFLTMVAAALEDYYAILGIHSTANFDEIRAAYVKKFRELNAARGNPELSVETALDKSAAARNPRWSGCRLAGHMPWARCC